ncbi:Ku protein [Ramlibacter sp.]|uniref:non-homologous end joining protein Ku n=1 Tax=Ramlibacter sp. TaxID=1917967 RepID=UPI0017D49653|nr:Ku protein [Ramlibacter sp.]MBA2674611.1 Ku protein [Ramlibacter sp.]
MADTKGMAPSSTRALWKGAISFGLVHIPIGLYSATAESDLDFDWLDKRTMDPVGYKRINKKTGKDIDKDDIVKGIEYHKGEYVLLSPEEIQDAYPKTTQTIEIEAFVDVDDVPFVYLERPYYTAPINKGERVYALLREALKQTGKAGIARVVIRAKQHLAVLMPCGPALVLNLMRWGNEIRSWDDLPLPATGAKTASLKDGELKMAKQLIDDMSGNWSAEEYRDSFRDAVMKLVEAKAKAGETEAVEPLEEAPDTGKSADVIDLTELLRRSLQGGKGRAATKTPAAAPAPAAAKKPARKRETAAAAQAKSPPRAAAKKTAAPSAAPKSKARRTG